MEASGPASKHPQLTDLGSSVVRQLSELSVNGTWGTGEWYMIDSILEAGNKIR